LVLHGSGAAGIIALPVFAGIRSLLLLALAGHLLWRWPAATPVLVAYPNGTWAVPRYGLCGLRPGSGTRSAPSWIRLVFAGGRRSCRIVLFRDQFDARDWRDLRARLRYSARIPAGDSAA